MRAMLLLVPDASCRRIVCPRRRCRTCQQVIYDVEYVVEILHVDERIEITAYHVSRLMHAYRLVERRLTRSRYCKTPTHR